MNLLNHSTTPTARDDSVLGTSHPDTNTDEADLHALGYTPQLNRTLGRFSAFAAGFTYISLFAGLFQMFHLGFAAGGPQFFWSWPLVLFGQFWVALGFAELAAHYPLSGGLYQWAKQVGSEKVGWLTGWVYFICLLFTLAAVALALQGVLPQLSPAFQLIGRADDPSSAQLNATLWGIVLILGTTWVNSSRNQVLAFLNNLGVFIEFAGVIALIGLLGYSAIRPVHEAVAVMPRGWDELTSFLTATALTASYVLYGFDTAGTLAEETRNPRQNAPWAILNSLGAAGLAGCLLILFSLMAAPSLEAPELGQQQGGLPWVVTTVLGSRFGNGILLCVVYSIFVCALAVQTGMIRILFAMARDQLFPSGQKWSQVSLKNQAPTAASLLSGGLAISVLLLGLQFPKAIELIASSAILWANLAYAMVTLLLFKKRLQGWPHPNAAGSQHFSLGRWGIPINLMGSAFSLFMVINVAWPRASVYGESCRSLPIWLTLALLALGFFLYPKGRLKKTP
jgi:urea carboxylase system permease